MQTSRKRRSSAMIPGLYQQQLQEIEPFYLSQIIDSNGFSVTGNQEAMSFQSADQFFTLDSSTTATNSAGFTMYDSPSAVSISSSRSPFSPPGSQSCFSEHGHSPENYGSPFSGSSVDDSYGFRHKLREVEALLLGPESELTDSCNCCSRNSIDHGASSASADWDRIVEMIPKMDLKEALFFCAQAVNERERAAESLLYALEKMVSVSGDPIQRLGTYLLESLRARLESSGGKIYKALKCKEPTSTELMSYMHSLFNVCPYWKFAYTSANAVIKEVLENESRLHIIDFQIAQGSQWMMLIAALSRRPGGPPQIRITAVDDYQSYTARGGGLHIVGQKLTDFAKTYNVQVEFNDAGVPGHEVERHHLNIQPGEPIAVNFPYILHHMPDESVSTRNPRDRLLRLVKSLSPKVVTLVEQESNTNTSSFNVRFRETLNYYTAMFESIDACGLPRDDRHRISAEQNCVARDIVNMIACEGAERVERHEPLGKWRSRLRMAGFHQYPISHSVIIAVSDVLKDYSKKYRLEQRDMALYMYWGNRAMSTSSAWR